MIRQLHRISAIAFLGIGLAHVAATFFVYERLSEPAIWFAGSGLGAIFAALLNFALWPREASTLARGSAAAANFLLFFWLAAGVSATPDLGHEIVAGVGAMMVITAALGARRR